MSGSKSTATTSTAQTDINQQVGASEGSTAIGAGASVNVTTQTLDANLAQESVKEVGNIASEANEAVKATAALGIQGTAGVAESSIAAQNIATGRALDFGDASLGKVFEFAKEFTDKSQQSSARTQELIAAQAGVTSPATFGQAGELIKYVVIAGVILGGLYMLRKRAA